MNNIVTISIGGVMSEQLKEKSVDSALVISELDQWVARQGNGQYSPSDFKPINELALYPDYGIQQERSELLDFINEIIKRGLSEKILEIGLGRYGSTHFLWRLLFKQVITIERLPERCLAFARNYSAFYNGVWPTSDDHSAFIIGSSTDPASVRKAHNATARQLDLLFIDGDHSYQGVLCDWLLYHNLVRKGGIVAFHDSATNSPNQSEVPDFLKKLEAGGIDGKNYSLNYISHSRHFGIAFYDCK